MASKTKRPAAAVERQSPTLGGPKVSPIEPRPTLHPELDEAQKQTAFRQGVELFNAGRYFEAHEPWEEIWRSTSPEPRDLFQGLVQVAAGLHIWRNKKKAPAARRVLARGCVRLRSPCDFQIGQERLLVDLEPWLDWLRDPVGPEPPEPRIRVDTLPPSTFDAPSETTETL